MHLTTALTDLWVSIAAALICTGEKLCTALRIHKNTKTNANKNTNIYLHHHHRHASRESYVAKPCYLRSATSRKHPKTCSKLLTARGPPHQPNTQHSGLCWFVLHCHKTFPSEVNIAPATNGNIQLYFQFVCFIFFFAFVVGFAVSNELVSCGWGIWQWVFFFQHRLAKAPSSTQMSTTKKQTKSDFNSSRNVGQGYTCHCLILFICFCANSVFCMSTANIIRRGDLSAPISDQLVLFFRHFLGCQYALSVKI